MTAVLCAWVSLMSALLLLLLLILMRVGVIRGKAADRLFAILSVI